MKDIQTAGLIEKCRPYLPDPSGTILELGCGSGKFLLGLHRHGYGELTGVDQNPTLAEAFHGTSIRYIDASLEDELILAPPYHAVVMHAVIEHLLEPEKLLRRCHGWLEPGGHVIIRTPSADSLCHRVFGRYWAGLHSPRHTRIFNRENLSLIARNSGFDPPRWIPVEDPSGWAFSLQNLIVSRCSKKSYQSGTAWYSLATMPLWFPFSIIETLLGRPSMLFCALRKPRK